MSKEKREKRKKWGESRFNSKKSRRKEIDRFPTPRGNMDLSRRLMSSQPFAMWMSHWLSFLQRGNWLFLMGREGILEIDHVLIFFSFLDLYFRSCHRDCCYHLWFVISFLIICLIFLYRVEDTLKRYIDLPHSQRGRYIIYFWKKFKIKFWHLRVK